MPHFLMAFQEYIERAPQMHIVLTDQKINKTLYFLFVDF